MQKKILFVCLGNICRSPAAEAIFLTKLSEQKLLENFEVDSAGTGGWHVGRKADSRMRNVSLNRGIEIKSIARQITLDDLTYYDFIFTMDYANLRDVKALAEELNSQKQAEIIPLLEYVKNTFVLEVPDPYYGGDNGFEQVLDILENAIDQLIIKLR